MPVFQLTQALAFPNPRFARAEGLLAVGGDLSLPRLLLAYQSGIFPWFAEGDPYLWWSPDPRAVLWPADLRIARSMRPLLRRQPWEVRLNTAFSDVLRYCAQGSLARPEEGTWLTSEMQAAYTRLHEAGYAHSVEAWEGGRLVGGLYGMAMGRIFFGESMFTLVPDASKYAFVHLVVWLREKGYRLIDCQQSTRHLQSLGATEIPRQDFLDILAEEIQPCPPPQIWQGVLPSPLSAG